jgi:Zn-dependent peptidase ImmA (M78 family)
MIDTVPIMFHPWRRLRARPDVEVFYRDLRGRRLAATDGAEVIVMSPDLSQAQRRSTIAHELAHIELGHVDGCSSAEEEAARQLAARWLVSLDALAEAMAWARSLEELAEELWVDVDTVRTRLAHLHPAERHHLRARLAPQEQPC